MGPSKNDVVSRFVGNCQLCEGDFKLYEANAAGEHVLVHHGYKRPGDGMIHGDCPGVKAVPYERSCDLIRVHLGWAKSRLENEYVYLKRLLNGEVLSLTKLDSRARRSVWDAPREPAVWVEYRVGVTAPHIMHTMLQSEKSEIQGIIRQTERTIARLEKRILDWKLAPVRTVEEIRSREDTAKAERKASKDAARAALVAKRHAYQARVDAREAVRKGIRDELASQFVAFAATGRVSEARSLFDRTMNDKKMLWLSWYDLPCADALVALGIAVRDSGRLYLARPMR